MSYEDEILQAMTQNVGFNPYMRFAGIPRGAERYQYLNAQRNRDVGNGMAWAEMITNPFVQDTERRLAQANLDRDAELRRMAIERENKRYEDSKEYGRTQENTIILPEDTGGDKTLSEENKSLVKKLKDENVRLATSPRNLADRERNRAQIESNQKKIDSIRKDSSDITLEAKGDKGYDNYTLLDEIIFGALDKITGNNKVDDIQNKRYASDLESMLRKRLGTNNLNITVADPDTISNEDLRKFLTSSPSMAQNLYIDDRGRIYTKQNHTPFRIVGKPDGTGFMLERID